METVGESWTDERLDHLNRRVEDGFAHVDRRFEEVDRRFEQVDKRFEQVDQRFEQVDKRLDGVETEIRLLRMDMNSRFEAVDDRLHALQRTMLVFCTTMMATLAGLGGTQLFLLLTRF